MSNGQNQSAASSAARENFVSAMIPALWAIGNLKRIRAAHLGAASFAENLFRRAWNALAAGASVRRTAIKITTDAVAGAQLGAIDRSILQEAHLNENQIKRILNRSFDSVSSRFDENLKSELQTALSLDFPILAAGAPQFVDLLARQPRSGATKIGAPKLVFDCPENHAEHCITVAVYGVLLAPVFQADAEMVFLTALAHHFHNAYLPDSGFAGEEMLGEFLPQVFAAFREKCLSELPAELGERIRRTFPLLERAELPESKAFHAADVIDRVLQMRHHAEANQFTLEYALEEMELVHVGAVQQFHYEILREARLIG